MSPLSLIIIKHNIGVLMSILSKSKDLAKNTGYFAIGTTVIAGIYVAKGSKRVSKLASYTIDTGKATFNEMVAKDKPVEKIQTT